MSDASSSIASQCALNAARAEAGRVTQRSSPSLQRSTRPPLSDQVRCTPIGLALYYFAYSTFLGWPTLYLEDLFVLPEERGRGAGKALLAELARIAVRRGCGRLEWAVLDWNTPSIRFYKRLGARLRKEWILTRLSGPALRRLAARSRTKSRK